MEENVGSHIGRVSAQKYAQNWAQNQRGFFGVVSHTATTKWKGNRLLLSVENYSKFL
jgi:hypothetical protein